MIQEERFKKILVIRFSSIGDIVLTSPVVRCLKRAFPNSKLDFIMKQGFKETLEHNPYIDKIHFYEKGDKKWIDSLKMESYDLIIDLQKNYKSYKICSQIGAKTIRFDKLNIKKWWFVRTKQNVLPAKHLVERYFDALKEIGVEYDGAGLDYYITDANRNTVRTLLPDSSYNVLVLGAAHFTKRIPESKCLEIVQNSTLPVILLGGKDVSDVAKDVENIFNQKVINLTGKISLNESAAILEKASQIITGDTGLMHIGAALQKKMTVVWGNTMPAFGMYPFYNNQNLNNAQSLEVASLSCRPCSKLGFDNCPKKHFKCMMDQKIPNEL